MWGIFLGKEGMEMDKRELKRLVRTETVRTGIIKLCYAGYLFLLAGIGFYELCRIKKLSEIWLWGAVGIKFVGCILLVVYLLHFKRIMRQIKQEQEMRERPQNMLCKVERDKRDVQS